MTTIQDTFSRFSADPDSARTQPAVTATLTNGFARASAGPFNWDVDLPGPLGGGNQAPSRPVHANVSEPLASVRYIFVTR